MTTAGIASIALFAPLMASNAVFSTRRVSRGIDAMDENPLYGVTNFGIAAGQILKGGKAANSLLNISDPAVLNFTETSSKKNIKNISNLEKAANKVGKVVSFTADYINPVIIGAGVLKVAGSDDKLDASARESTALLTMFAAEKATKEFVGMPVTKKIDGEQITLHKDGLYKKFFSQKQLDAMEDFFATKKSFKECSTTKKILKAVPGTTKGLLFVGASIGGYKLGHKIVDGVLGEEKKSENN